jgi:Heavy metal associated domain 2
MKAKAHVAHSIPGRIRLRVHNRHHDPGFFRDLEHRLSHFPQVKSVATNARTGSVLVHHSGAAFDLLMLAAEAGLGEMIDFEPPAPVARQLRAQFAQLDETVQHATEGRLDLSTLAMIALFAVAGLQLVRGNQPVISVTLAWYAAELLRRWEGPAGAHRK